MKLNIPICKKHRDTLRHTAALPVKANITIPEINNVNTPVQVSNTLNEQSQTEFAKPFYTDYVQQNNVAGEEKQLALMFLDIRNFTPFMEQRSAYDVIYVIRKLFALFNDSIREAGGRIIETQGDSIYAAFGLNSDVEFAVKASVDASMAIFHDLEVFNATYAQPYFNLNFEIGIGLHQGNVLVGMYDIDYNDHLTIMGLPVNIASRLQSKTKDLNNDLLISEDAYRLLNMPGGDIESRHIKLKGISEPVQVRLMGQPYNQKPSGDDMMDYFIAMAG
ncbi:adenylate/guanylate cyclase domain-containing protein [Mucilaginibacter terrae]|uniref:Adenylate cyclase n=1 Tax=Mucilaginibacter terrae TaxID=1955052 RepID=A0ABU3GQN2_9SPHI|nr:adenylate/guanylate cyclase domain-containing protein [Mucilaginibacter terrae]MDT3402088.1 adenylate cyclase [Mucilaginibacter terrae]